MNERNLIPFTAEQSREEAVRNGAKGGKASAEARRKRKDLKAKMQMLLEMPPADNDRETLEAMGVSAEDMNNETMLAVSVLLSALGGDMKAFDRVERILGKDIAHEELALKKRELKLKEKAAADNCGETLAKLDDVLGKIEGGF